MKRRLFTIFLMTLLLLSLAACGGQGESGSDQPAAGQTRTGGEETREGYVFLVSSASDYAVSIDDDMAGVLDALGEPNQYFEAASCAFNGLDKTYTYAGFVIITRPDGDKDFVQSIRLTDDSVTTPEGIYIGCSADEVTAAYGEGEKTDTLLICASGHTALYFVLENEKVISIEYLPV